MDKPKMILGRDQLDPAEPVFKIWRLASKLFDGSRPYVRLDDVIYDYEELIEAAFRQVPSATIRRKLRLCDVVPLARSIYEWIENIVAEWLKRISVGVDSGPMPDLTIYQSTLLFYDHLRERFAWSFVQIDEAEIDFTMDVLQVGAMVYAVQHEQKPRYIEDILP